MNRWLKREGIAHQARIGGIRVYDDVAIREMWTRIEAADAAL